MKSTTRRGRTGASPHIFPATGLSLGIRWLRDRVNWLAVVDGLLPWDLQQAKIAPSVGLLTLIMNGLTQRNPLYRVEDWVATAPVRLTYGHTKDHRPDLRQIMRGLTVDDFGQVVGGTMLSGNTSDRQWHRDGLDQLAGEMPEEFWREIRYLCDAALITEAAMQMDWLGRLPAGYRLTKS